jgi:adenosylcobinamide-GDP ribazoletransferase
MVMQSFLAALGFLTVVPVRLHSPVPVAVVARSRFWYPLVGVLLGAVLGGWTALLVAAEVRPLAGAFLVLIMWALATGLLHLDGFCDLCDGLFGGASAEERLRILKDPHLGTFALGGGVLLLLGKFVLLEEAFSIRAAESPWLVGGSVAAARCLVLCMAAGARYPRPEGTGKVVVEATQPGEAVLFAALTAVIVAVTMSDGPLRVAVVFLAGFAAVIGLRVFCQRRLGGITGDCLGAGIETAESVLLLAALLMT